MLAQRTLGTLLVCLLSQPFWAQNIDVNRTNKTISIMSEGSAEADAEVALVEVGHQNFGPTRDQTYQEAVQAASRITQALQQAGIPRENIETTRLRFSQNFGEDKVLQQVARNRKFVANQAWSVRVPAADAQKVIDLAMSAGANVLGGVAWTVKDPARLQARASAAALARARAIAEEIARGLGAKLGELLYASNHEARSYGLEPVGGGGGGGFARESGTVLPLFPEKVTRDATVQAVFSIQ